MKIKNTLLIMSAIIAMNTSVKAANFALEWDHDSQAEEKVSFIVEKKDANGIWTAVSNIPVGIKFVEFLDISAGVYTYRVIAVSLEGIKSEPSNELTVKVPNSPKNIRVKIR